MVDVFEQVEEELRSARYSRLARTWLPVVGGILLIALIAALGWWGWQSYEDGRAEKASVAYDRGLEALQKNDIAGADLAFTEAAKEGNGAYKALALMERGGIAVQSNQTPKAVVFFDDAAKASSDPLIADPASLKAVYLLMDTAPLADIQKRLEPLVKDDRPFRAFAQEAQAMSLLQNNKGSEARDILVQLTLGQDVPDVVRQRAQAAIEVIDTGETASIGAIVKAANALPPQPVAPPQPAGPQGPMTAPAAEPASAPVPAQ